MPRGHLGVGHLGAMFVAFGLGFSLLGSTLWVSSSPGEGRLESLDAFWGQKRVDSSMSQNKASDQTLNVISGVCICRFM